VSRFVRRYTRELVPKKNKYRFVKNESTIYRVAGTCGCLALIMYFATARTNEHNSQ